ncbi:MAG: Gfo/Idh/MocA family oxidoreductase, partial [candidate division Zixibacteria bacterium]|nr:Gfo/Idh/MocA family oxidoreductase [candidate division Zixibacteria bacterium]
MNKLKTGVVGVGALGRHHLRWYSQIAESELVGFYDTDPEKQKQYADEYKIKAFQTVEELAENVDAVSIVVPTSLHYEIAQILIGKSVHCLIEKPVTTSVEQAEKLKQLAIEKNVKVTVGQIERFNPAVIAIKENGAIPAFIEAHRLAAFDPRGTDVAVVLDLMIHDIDLILHLVKSKVTDIQASAIAVISEQVDIANARVTFDNGAVANLTASRISLNAMRKLRIFQKSGYFSLDLAKKQADIYQLSDGEKTEGAMVLPLGKSGKNLAYKKMSDTGVDMLGNELTTFLKAVIDDKPVAVTINEASEALRIALEVERIGKESSA